jgi:hypothetical protein
MIRVRILAGAENFSLHHHVQTSSGNHPASYPVGTRGSFPGVKAAGAWSWPLISIYYRNQRMHGSLPPFPNYVFMAWCLLKPRDNLTLTVYIQFLFYLCFFVSSFLPSSCV